MVDLSVLRPLFRSWAIYVAAGVALAYLLVATVLDKGVSNLDRTVAIIVGAASLLALLRLGFPKGLKAGEWKKPKASAELMNIAIGVFGVTSGAVGMMAPRPAVESAPGVIESLVRSLSSDVKDIKQSQQRIESAIGTGQVSLVRQNITGEWGEEGCALVRQFVLEDRALKVDTVRAPSGVEPYSWLFTVEADANSLATGGMRSSTMTVTEREGPFPGQSVKFHYRTDGVSERLVWDGENDVQPTLELKRCKV